VLLLDLVAMMSHMLAIEAGKAGCARCRSRASAGSSAYKPLACSAGGAFGSRRARGIVGKPTRTTRSRTAHEPGGHQREAAAVRAARIREPREEPRRGS